MCRYPKGVLIKPANIADSELLTVSLKTLGRPLAINQRVKQMVCIIET